MCMSIQNIAEAHFVEATDLRNKKIIFGVIYRHPNTDVDNLSSKVIGKIISTITKEIRECIHMGDFNINFLNHQSMLLLLTFSTPCQQHFFSLLCPIPLVVRVWFPFFLHESF